MLYSQISLWVHFGVVQFKTRDDAHWESTLLAHVGGGFALMPSLLAAYHTLCLSPLSRWCAGEVVWEVPFSES